VVNFDSKNSDFTFFSCCREYFRMLCSTLEGLLSFTLLKVEGRVGGAGEWDDLEKNIRKMED